MLLLCCIVYLCIVVCTCIVYFSYSGMEERLCRMPEFKLINQSISQYMVYIAIARFLTITSEITIIICDHC